MESDLGERGGLQITSKGKNKLGLISALLIALFWFLYTVFNTVLTEPPRLFGPVTLINVLYIPMIALLAASVFRNGLLNAASIRMMAGYIFFYVWVALGLLWYDSTTTADVFQRLIVYALCPIVAFQLQSKYTNWLAHGILASSLLVSLWTIFHSVRSGFGYRGGVPVNPNFLTILIGFGLLVAVVWYFEGKSRWHRRWPLLVAMVIMTYASLILGSRGVSVALVAAIVAVFWKMRLDRSRMVALVAMVLVAVTFTQAPTVIRYVMAPINVVREFVAERSEDRVDVDAGAGANSAANTRSAPRGSTISRFGEGDLATLNYRTDIWKAGLQYSSASVRNFLIGGGIGHANIVVQAADPRFDSIHSLFFQILIDFGLIGLLAFVYFHLVLLRSLWSNTTWEGFWAISGMVFMLVVGLTTDVANLHVYWVFLGLAASVVLSSFQSNVSVRGRHTSASEVPR